MSPTDRLHGFSGSPGSQGVVTPFHVSVFCMTSLQIFRGAVSPRAQARWTASARELGKSTWPDAGTCRTLFYRHILYVLRWMRALFLSCAVRL